MEAEKRASAGSKKEPKINGQQVHKLILKEKGRDGPSDNPNQMMGCCGSVRQIQC